MGVDRILKLFKQEPMKPSTLKQDQSKKGRLCLLKDYPFKVTYYSSSAKATILGKSEFRLINIEDED